MTNTNYPTEVRLLLNDMLGNNSDLWDIHRLVECGFWDFIAERKEDVIASIKSNFRLTDQSEQRVLASILAKVIVAQRFGRENALMVDILQLLERDSLNYMKFTASFYAALTDPLHEFLKTGQLTDNGEILLCRIMAHYAHTGHYANLYMDIGFCTQHISEILKHSYDWALPQVTNQTTEDQNVINFVEDVDKLDLIG